jgi:hypothetical protein
MRCSGARVGKVRFKFERMIYLLNLENVLYTRISGFEFEYCCGKL